MLNSLTVDVLRQQAKQKEDKTEEHMKMHRVHPKQTYSTTTKHKAEQNGLRVTWEVMSRVRRKRIVNAYIL